MMMSKAENVAPPEGLGGPWRRGHLNLWSEMTSWQAVRMTCSQGCPGAAVGRGDSQTAEGGTEEVCLETCTGEEFDLGQDVLMASSPKNMSLVLRVRGLRAGAPENCSVIPRIGCPSGFSAVERSPERDVGSTARHCCGNRARPSAPQQNCIIYSLYGSPHGEIDPERQSDTPTGCVPLCRTSRTCMERGFVQGGTGSHTSSTLMRLTHLWPPEEASLTALQSPSPDPQESAQHEIPLKQGPPCIQCCARQVQVSTESQRIRE
ncbi:uncharacterized protein [Symphalangus syndactylus]|uniref:uncharacterized protein n=1 Tax=Symphalangus syndactylus TaxID=9590 RepID=UPI0030047D5A